MAQLLLVPEVAAGATEVVISEWLAQPGSDVKVGDMIAVIETDKAVVEIEAEANGTLLRTLVEAGSLVGVGRPMALLGEAAQIGTDLDSVLASLGFDSAPAAAPAPERRDVEQAIPSDPGATIEPAGALPSAAPQPPSGRVFISPIARKLLGEAGLGVEDVVGTGPGGRIRRRDVEKAVEKQAAPTAAAPTVEAPAPVVAQPNGPWTEVPHSRLRRAVARRLTESKRDVPHFYVKRSARLDALLALRTQLTSATGQKISVNDFLIRAMAVAHCEVPDANAIWTDETMRMFDSVDISVAVASERGLVTPVLRGVERLSLSAISTQVRNFVKQANAGKLQQADLEGGSISISNLGMFGVEEFSAIINPPQSAILAVGAGRPVPIAEDGEVVVRTVVDLVLSVDHRAIDGALAAQWMSALVDAIENPLTLVI